MSILWYIRTLIISLRPYYKIITSLKLVKKNIPKGVEVLEACRQAHHCEDLTCTFQHLQIKDLNQPKKKEEEVICSYS